VRFLYIEVSENEDSISGIVALSRVCNRAGRCKVLILQAVLLRTLDCSDCVPDLYRFCSRKKGLNLELYCLTASN